MSEMIAVVFSDEEGRTTGDSACNPEIGVTYHDGMSLDEIIAQYTKKLVYGEFSVDGLRVPDDVDKRIEEEYDSFGELLEEEGLDGVNGAWIVSERDYNIIMSGGHDVGNDSALYAMIHGLKCQIEAASIKTIER